jgi:hypothetical protein
MSPTPWRAMRTRGQEGVGMLQGQCDKMRERVWARTTPCAKTEDDSDRHAKRRMERQTASGAPNPKRQRTGYKKFRR